LAFLLATWSFKYVLKGAMNSLISSSLHTNKHPTCIQTYTVNSTNTHESFSTTWDRNSLMHLTHHYAELD